MSHRAKNLASLIAQGGQGFNIGSLLAKKDPRTEQRHDPRRLTH
jgi:hypothetical protein